MVTEYDDSVRIWDWTRHPKQDAFVWDRHRFAVWQGGRGSTKTTSGMCRIWTTIADLDTGEIRPEWRGARILIAAPVFKQVKRGPVVKFDEVFDDTGLVLRKINGNSPRRDLDGDVEVHFFNVGPTGEGAEAWRGAEYAIFYPDEVAQMPEKTFNLGNATLRQKRRDGSPYEYQTIMTTTPLGQNWLWRRLLNPDTRAEYRSESGAPMYPDDKLFIIESSTRESIDAGILEPDYIANMGYLPGTLKYQEEVEGKVVATAGMVFEQNWHTISPENPLPKHFEAVYGGIDYGTVDPTVIILAGIDERGAVWIFKEYYQARAKFHEYADLMGDWQQEFTVRQWAADSDLLVRMMRGAGLRTRTPYKAKDAAGVAVNYVNQLISRGMFNIDPHCYGLISEMRSYRHKSMFDGDEVTFLQKVEPNQSDHCLVAHTPVLTLNGDRWIERIREGDYVLTRKGYRRVLSSRMTNPTATVFDVHMSNDEVLRGTGNHPVWVEGKGWTRLDELTQGDTLLSWQDQNPSPSTASSSGAIQTRNDGRIASTSFRDCVLAGTASADSTRKSGSLPTGTFHLDATSTTATVIHSTTTSVTSSWYRSTGTEQSTPTDGESAAAAPNNSPFSVASAIWRNPGMVLRKALRGIASTRYSVGPIVFAGLSNAATVDEISIHAVRKPRSVPTPANRRVVEPTIAMTSNVAALIAAASSQSTAIANNAAAPVRVEHVTPVAGKYPVYNLTVEDAPEFYACGVLVHNSIDAMRYAVLPLSSAAAAKNYGQKVEFAYA